MSFTKVEAPTEEEALWPLGPTDEPIASSEHSPLEIDLPTPAGHIFYVRVVSTNTNDQSEIFGGITSAEDGSGLKVGRAAGPWDGDSKDSLNVLVDSGAPRHYFDDAIIPGLRDKSDNY